MVAVVAVEGGGPCNPKNFAPVENAPLVSPPHTHTLCNWLQPVQHRAAVYVDNIIIFTTTWFEQLNAIFKELKKTHLTVTLKKKRNVAQTEVWYLGFQVGRWLINSVEDKNLTVATITGQERIINIFRICWVIKLYPTLQREPH